MLPVAGNVWIFHSGSGKGLEFVIEEATIWKKLGFSKYCYVIPIDLHSENTCLYIT